MPNLLVPPSSSPAQRRHLGETLTKAITSLLRDDPTVALPIVVAALAVAFGEVRPALVAAFDADLYFAYATDADCKAALAEMSFTRGLPKDRLALVKLCAQLAREEQWLPPELRIMRGSK